MVAMKDALSKLAESSQKLNEKSESLNKTIEQLEKRLQASQVGVSLWLDGFLLDESTPRAARDESGEESGTVVATGWMLGFAKIENEWRIVVREVRQTWTPAFVGTPNDNEETIASGEPRPLLKAPRAVRVEAAAHLEDLVKSLAYRADEFVEDISKVEALAKE